MLMDLNSQTALRQAAAQRLIDALDRAILAK
jgi:hypothetical protein